MPRDDRQDYRRPVNEVDVRVGKGVHPQIGLSHQRRVSDDQVERQVAHRLDVMEIVARGFVHAVDHGASRRQEENSA